MTNWIKTDDGLEATINGWVYLIEKTGVEYIVWCEGMPICDPCDTIADAKAAAEFHASDDPVPSKSGVHIDNIAGQQLVDILKRSFTTAQIQDFIDASPFDEPDTGAPEGPL